MALTDLMRQPITDLDGGKAFCDELIAHDMVFHFEDDPATIISWRPDRFRISKRLFTNAEAAIMRDRVRELYALTWGDHECPIGYVLDQTDAGHPQRLHAGLRGRSWARK